MATFKDYYKILGLSSNKATLKEIKIAYREQAKKYHPDMNQGIDEVYAEARFKDINEAYKTLTNEKLRRKYDFNWNRYIGRKTNTKEQREKKSIKEILVEIFFGGINKTKANPKKQPQYGENINTNIDISIKDGFFGTVKKLSFRNVNGKETLFNLRVPAGIQNGDKLRIVGQGKPGKNGGKSGDLLVYINIKNDKNLKIQGHNLYYELPITTWEAALGTKKEIQVLGEKIGIIIPKCTSSGEKITIKDKGYRDSRGNRGNLIVNTKIVVSKELTKKEKEIYNKLKSLEVKA